MKLHSNSTQDSPLLRNAIRLTKQEGLTPKQAARILAGSMRLTSQPGVVKGGCLNDTVYWRVIKRDWTSVRWITITAYDSGILCLRNDIIAAVPKNVWPFQLPSVRQFKLIVHWTEITAEFGNSLFGFCSAVSEGDLVLCWPLFAGHQTFPGYAWTQKASEIHKERHQRA